MSAVPRNTFRFYERFQAEITINWKLFPSSGMTGRQWLFDPVGGVILPGQELDNRWKLPNSTSWEVDTTMISGETLESGPKRFKSRVFWIHGAVRILGLDIGAGLYFRTSPIIKPHLEKAQP